MTSSPYATCNNISVPGIRCTVTDFDAVYSLKTFSNRFAYRTIFLARGTLKLCFSVRYLLALCGEGRNPRDPHLSGRSNSIHSKSRPDHLRRSSVSSLAQVDRFTHLIWLRPRPPTRLLREAVPLPTINALASSMSPDALTANVNSKRRRQISRSSRINAAIWNARRLLVTW